MNIHVYVWVILKMKIVLKNRVIINHFMRWGVSNEKSQNWKSSLRKLPGIFFLGNNGSKERGDTMLFGCWSLKGISNEINVKENILLQPCLWPCMFVLVLKEGKGCSLPGSAVSEVRDNWAASQPGPLWMWWSGNWATALQVQKFHFVLHRAVVISCSQNVARL